LGTWVANKRDHWLGIQWAEAIPKVLPSPRPPERLEGSKPGRISLDLVLPFLITLILYGWIIQLAHTL